MKTEFPDVVIGDTEPLAGPADDNAYKAWLDAFYQVNGYHLAFLHMDVDWSRIHWPQEVKAIEDYGREIGVPVGIIYTGSSIDKTDEAWLEAAGERVKTYELQAGGQPAQVLFQSWDDKPDFVLPENGEYTFTQFINAYFENKAALGFRREGAGANLALEKSVQASRQIADNPAWMAVDGDPGTWWSAGGGPPKWIEVDLGAEYSVKEIRLIPSQYPAGRTVHTLLVKGSGTGNEYISLITFDGETEDGQLLLFAPDTPLQGIRYVKVESTINPSWVAWREIEIIAAGE
ncbi:MAG: discoidin domain-containing protein [Chloroflexi bacterium]|nr:discoidin domain-containing protein [Chloroflexota bacterium]